MNYENNFDVMNIIITDDNHTRLACITYLMWSINNIAPLNLFTHSMIK